MEIYTDAMREVMTRRIDSYTDMAEHTIKETHKYSNSDGGKWLVIHFTDDYWMMFEPIRYYDNDVDLNILGDERFGTYEMYILFQLGIISESVYTTEHDLYMEAYRDNVFDMERNNILKWLPNHPEIYSEVSNIIGEPGG